MVTCCGAEQPVTDGDLRHDRSVGEGGGVEGLMKHTVSMSTSHRIVSEPVLYVPRFYQKSASIQNLDECKLRCE